MALLVENQTVLINETSLGWTESVTSGQTLVVKIELETRELKNQTEKKV